MQQLLGLQKPYKRMKENEAKLKLKGFKSGLFTAPYC